jgi:hypothetical protein
MGVAGEQSCGEDAGIPTCCEGDLGERREVGLRRPSRSDQAAETDIGENRAAFRVEHHVGGGEVAVDQSGAMDHREGLRERADQGDQFARREWFAALQEALERACRDVLTEEQPVAVGLSYVEEADDVRVVDGSGQDEVATEFLDSRDRGCRDAFEHGVPAGTEVPQQPDRAGRSGPEAAAQAVAGDVFECHVREDARIARGTAEVIHRNLACGWRRTAPRRATYTRRRA